MSSTRSPALSTPTPYAEVIEQIGRTVQQLLTAALAGARLASHEHTPATAVLPRSGRTARPVMQVPLSGREWEVLQCIAAGDSNKMIARALGVSPHTVKRHVANILDKLDLRSRSQAAVWWLSRPADSQSH
jgi:DNA-binding NarL/FixJ family response regulator